MINNKSFLINNNSFQKYSYRVKNSEESIAYFLFQRMCTLTEYLRLQINKNINSILLFDYFPYRRQSVKLHRTMPLIPSQRWNFSKKYACSMTSLSYGRVSGLESQKLDGTYQRYNHYFRQITFIIYKSIYL